MGPLIALFPMWIGLGVVVFIINKTTAAKKAQTAASRNVQTNNRENAQNLTANKPQQETKKRVNEQLQAPIAARGFDSLELDERPFKSMEIDRPFHSLEFHDDVMDDCFDDVGDTSGTVTSTASNKLFSDLMTNRNDVVRGFIWGEILNRHDEMQE